MFKTAIGNIVLVPVKLTIKEGSVNKLFSFTLTVERKSQEEMEDTPEKTIEDFLLENVKDWTGQRLVLLENNEPAPYSPEALKFMFKKYDNAMGIIWTDYQREAWCKAKN